MDIIIRIISGKYTVNNKMYKDLSFAEKQAFDNFIMNAKIEELETIVKEKR